MKLLKHLGVMAWLVFGISLDSKSQFFVDSNTPCPFGKIVKVDPDFYFLDGPIPFDRCFLLKYSLDHKDSIEYFTISPVDRYGNVSNSRRDLRVFIRSGWPKSAWDSVGAKYPYKTFFQHLDGARKFNDIAQSSDPSDNKKTVVVLRVPPLEPNRNYKIDLYTKDGQKVPGAYGSTSTMDFSSTAKFTVVPDFGFLAVFGTSGQGGLEAVVPYLGANINLRPIDKNIPMKMVLYKSWRHRITVTTGISLTSVKIDGKRDDLFTGKTLVTGIGYRLNNYLKLTTGTVWTKSLTSPAGETNFILLPYLGFTVDYEIAELFKGISSIFK